MKARSVFYFGKFVVMGFAFLALFTYVVMLLWNWLIPELFTGPELNYWQTLGIMILSKILFTGVIGHGHRPPSPMQKNDFWSHRPPRHSSHGDYWREKFEEKIRDKSGGETKQEDVGKEED